MPPDKQRIQSWRYKIIPRTLTFIVRDGSVLLLRIPDGRGPWEGQLNGIGGHVEQGEDPLSSARREIREETGLSPDDLTLAGVVIIDTGVDPGIGLYVYVGNTDGVGIQESREGTLEWVPLTDLGQFPLVVDLPDLIPRALASVKHAKPFSARYSTTVEGLLAIDFAL